MTQRMEEAGIADPPLFINKIVVHDGDVCRRAAKANPSKLEPKPQCIPEGRSLHRSELFIPRYARSEGRAVTSTQKSVRAGNHYDIITS